MDGGPTGFDNINADILNARVNLLADEGRRRQVDVVDTLRVLCRESGRRSHGIAAVGSDYFLVGLEATTQQKSERPQWRHEDDLETGTQVHVRSTRAVRAGYHQDPLAIHASDPSVVWGSRDCWGKVCSPSN